MSSLPENNLHTAHQLAQEFCTQLVKCLTLAPNKISPIEYAQHGSNVPPLRIGVAYSGGLDSSVLLQIANQARSTHIELYAFHVHHGISPHADAWLTHCADNCAKLGVCFASRKITLRYGQGEGIEQAAREQRYAALGEMCRDAQVSHLLTAHHLDDQAETVLLQMLRGSGVAGLVAMATHNTAPSLLGDAQTVIMRPLLAVSRTQLQAYVDARQLSHIDDESNTDPRFTRNALRLSVMPQLAQAFPGFQVRLARTSEHARAAQSLLEEVAQQDLVLCKQGEQLAIAPLLQLRAERRDNLFRYWLALHGKRMPATAWLREMWQQLASQDENAQPCIIHPECQIHLYHGLVYLTPRYDVQKPSEQPATFVWMGEGRMDFPSFHGSLIFEASERGVAVDWLMGKTLQLDYRQGGERLRLASNRPSRSLKQHYQAAKIPSWQRERTPLLSLPGQPGQSQLLFVPGLGIDSAFLSEAGPCMAIRWQATL